MVLEKEKAVWNDIKCCCKEVGEDVAQAKKKIWDFLLNNNRIQCTWNNFIDYYEHELYVSCYIVDNTGEIRKGKPFMIKYNKAKKTIRDAIIKEKFFSDISENEIILYRIFESEKYINVKLEKMEVSFIGKIWRDLLGSREERKEVIGSLYDFESKVLR